MPEALDPRALAADPRPLADQIRALLEASGATQREQYVAMALAQALIGYSKNPLHPDDLASADLTPSAEGPAAVAP
jgi:hypothetical protein